MSKKITNNRPHLATVEDFTNKFVGAALDMEEETGLPAVAVLAQLALETGWGRKVLRLYPQDSNRKVDSKNLFNIKASRSWKGKVGTRIVWEDKDKDGRRDADEYSRESFRIYDSYADSFKDYARLITSNERYAEAVAAKNDPEAYVEALQECGYATDGRYASKMKKIMAKNWTVTEV